jgi:endonuclease/exonuclease/phosphatase (EEP) superfamily protein YafD
MLAKPSPLCILSRIALNLLIALIGAYGLSVTGFLLLRALIGERWPAIGLYNSFLHLLTAPALVALLISLLLRKGWLAALVIAPALLFTGQYAPLFLPHSSAAPPQATPFTILSYNLNTANIDSFAVLQVIRAADADIVALQELNPLMADTFAAELSDQYPYQALHPSEDFSGQGILSRRPITADEYWAVDLGHQRALIEIGGQTSVVYNTHPTHPLRGLLRFDGSPRGAAIRGVLVRAADETLPVLLVGDFNMSDLSEDYARVTARYRDVFREVGWGMGFTFPSLGSAFSWGFIPPLLARIDYVFVDGAFTPLDARVLDVDGGSDHRPLWARLALAASG